MNVNWFTPMDRGLRVNDSVYKMIFTEKPKGIRFNAHMSKKLDKKGVKYIQIGSTDDGNGIVIKPTYDPSNAYALIGNKHAFQVSAAALFNWADKKGLTGKRVDGEWDDEEDTYIFNVSSISDNEVEDEATN